MTVNEALRAVFDAGQENGTLDGWGGMQNPDLIFGAVREIALREIIPGILEHAMPERRADFARITDEILARLAP